MIGDHRRPMWSQLRLHRSWLSSASAAGASQSKLVSARDLPGSWGVGLGVGRGAQSWVSHSRICMLVCRL